NGREARHRRTARSSRVFPGASAREPLPRRQHAELVVVGIGHDDGTGVALTDVHTTRTQRDETLHLAALIAVGGRSDVEMQPVLAELRGQGRAEGNEPTGA